MLEKTQMKYKRQGKKNKYKNELYTTARVCC